jgi:hypothetical protein
VFSSKKAIIMKLAVNTQSFGSVAKKQTESTLYQAPKRLSKAGQWMRENPGGIFEVKDRKAVNR